MNSVHNRKSETVRVLVAGCSRMHTQLLSDALERDARLQVVNWNCDSSSLIPSVLAHKVDVIAISSTLDGNSTQGLEVVRQLRTVSPRTKAVVLLDSQHDQTIISALRAGARGIFSSDSSVDLFSKCMHNVHRGEIWIDGRGVALAIDALASAPVLRPVGAGGSNLLSKREREVCSARCKVSPAVKLRIAST